MRFFISQNGQPEMEVSRMEFIRAEREAGFYPKRGTYKDLATAGFRGVTSLGGREIRGRVETEQPESGRVTQR